MAIFHFLRRNIQAVAASVRIINAFIQTGKDAEAALTGDWASGVSVDASGVDMAGCVAVMPTVGVTVASAVQLDG